MSECQSKSCCAKSDGVALKAPNFGGGTTALELSVAQMDCPTEEALIRSKLAGISQFIRLSKQVNSILKQNIFTALAIKAVFLLLAVAGSATLWMAVFADMGASLLVVFNGLRLLRQKT